jgi:serine carboxypeptidase-like clade II
MFYLLLESQNNFQTDPLLIWTNGGPACSSMYGFLVENGPFQMIDNTTDFKPNQWSWNRNASVLYIDHPAGVGFSICGAGIGQCKVDDLTDSEENLKSLNAWYDKFPEYNSHDLWISGESYAGVYVPYWVWQID